MRGIKATAAGRPVPLRESAENTPAFLCVRRSRPRSSNPNKFGAALLLALSFASAGLAAQQKPQAPVPSPNVETPISAGALKYGLSLADEASEPLKKWARSYVEKQMRQHDVDSKTTAADVDTRFTGSSQEMRDAIAYLVFYLAYKDTDDDVRGQEFRIKEIDHQSDQLTDQIDTLNLNAQRRNMSGAGLTMRDQMQLQQEVDQRQSELRPLADERRLKAMRVAADQKKISAYLNFLGAAFPCMKAVQPSTLRGVK